MEEKFRFDYRESIKDIYDLLNIGEESLQMRLGKHIIETGEKVNKSPKEQWPILGLIAIGKEYKYARDLPNLLRRALFSSIFFFFESTLNSLAQHLENKYSLPLHPNDLKGHGIKRLQIYYKKVVEIAFPDQSNEWDILLKYNKIRNIIAHGSGEVPFEKLDNFEKVISNLTGIGLDNDDVLQIDENFCFKALETVDQFMKQLFKILDAEKPGWEAPPAYNY